MPFMNAAVLLHLIRKHPRCRKARIEDKEVWGIWDDEAVIDELGIGIQTTDPQFRCRTIDVKNSGMDTEVEIDSQTWRIKTNMPDGQEMWSVLRLRE